MDFCVNLSGLADFVNTVDRGSAEFLTRIPDCACLMFGSWVLNEIWIIDLPSALVSMLVIISSSKIFIFSKEFHLNSGGRLLLELYCVVIKHVAFFTIWAKLIVVFTCTSLPLNLYTSVFGCGFGFGQKFWLIDGFAEKRARIGGFAYPYSPHWVTGWFTVMKPPWYNAPDMTPP